MALRIRPRGFLNSFAIRYILFLPPWDKFLHLHILPYFLSVRFDPDPDILSSFVYLFISNDFFKLCVLYWILSGQLQQWIMEEFRTRLLWLQRRRLEIPH